jgi:hypothetical protein
MGKATFSEDNNSMMDDVSETIEVGSYNNKVEGEETISDLQKEAMNTSLKINPFDKHMNLDGHGVGLPSVTPNMSKKM